MSTGRKPEKISGREIRFESQDVFQRPGGFRVWLSEPHDRFTNTGLNMQTEIQYKGERIVQNHYNAQHESIENMGFPVNRAYVVMDEFDEPSLPIIEQWFWSPIDAMQAIDLCKWAEKFFNFKKWPTTIAHEYHVLMAYKRHIAQVYITIRDVRKILDSNDGLEDEAEIIERAKKRLLLLDQVVHEGNSSDRHA